MGTILFGVLAIMGLIIASWYIVGIAVIFELLSLILPGWLMVIIGIIAVVGFLVRKWL